MDAHMEQLGPYRYCPDPACFPLGRDSLALGGFATLRPRWRVCDLGCSGGLLLLLLAGRMEGLRLTGVELSPQAAQAARDNLARNGLSGTILTGDLRTLPAEREQWDLVVSNPPYFAAGSGRSGGPARMEETCTLAQLSQSAARLLRFGGRFALVHRPERLADLVTCLRACNLEPKRMALLQHDALHPPSALLMEAVKGGKPGLEFLPVYYEYQK